MRKFWTKLIIIHSVFVLLNKKKYKILTDGDFRENQSKMNFIKKILKNKI